MIQRLGQIPYTELLLDQRAADDPDRPDLEDYPEGGPARRGPDPATLAFSRKQVLQPKEVDLNQAVDSLQGILTRLIREDIRLTWELARPLRS